MYIIVFMDIIKYLNKANIKLKVIGDFFEFTLPDNSKKIVKQKELEQYLFICLLDYVNDENT